MEIPKSFHSKLHSGKICTHHDKRHLRTFALSPQPTHEDFHPSSAMKTKACSVRQVCSLRFAWMIKLGNGFSASSQTGNGRFFSFVDIFDKRQTQTILPEPSLSIVWTMLLTTASNLIDGQKRQNLLKSQS